MQGTRLIVRIVVGALLVLVALVLGYEYLPHRLSPEEKKVVGTWWSSPVKDKGDWYVFRPDHSFAITTPEVSWRPGELDWFAAGTWRIRDGQLFMYVEKQKSFAGDPPKPNETHILKIVELQENELLFPQDTLHRQSSAIFNSR
jgi:hypothetical protein